MKEQIISIIVDNLITILGFVLSVISISITVYIYKKDKTIKGYEKQLDKKQNTINMLANQVKAYYALQNILIDEIAKHNSENPEGLKRKYHKQVLDSEQNLDVKGWLASNKANEYIK
jgi:peptidoglycan hydrolase CwlO-like protein